ncbi:response regulator transcription factor [Rhodococcus sp. P1Y]|uniref:response regulator transcription factor n=1 Tax=Rhodococcus sp. P1Y TaxID=1302308 RepID=UPI000EB2B5A4|nr:response regulator transcription factor [Rhodococcus sp. P1Y]AYJ50389.1 DNA-binding response regulator [Rhodococcus sp. P1Y]
MIRVLLADDQEIIRQGLRAILDAVDGIEVTADVADGAAAVRAVRDGVAEVVLMDLRMPVMDGVEATRRIREFASADTVKIVVLTTFDKASTVLEALTAGANGFLSKGVGPAELASRIREVAAGGAALSSSAAASLIDHVAESRPRAIDSALRREFDALTPRELEAVLAAATGESNAGIAAGLHLSPFTVKTHINRAMTKVGARDRAQLIAFAYRAGLVD